MIRTLFIAVALLLLGNTCFAQPSAPNDSIIVAQPDSPIEIARYDAGYLSVPTICNVGDCVRHNLDLLTKTDKKIKAVQVGLISFDLFNDFLDRTYGIVRDEKFEKGKKRNSTWITTSLSDVAHGTGVAWISKIRFENGEVWVADEENIIKQLRTIQSNFDAALLREKRAVDSPQ